MPVVFVRVPARDDVPELAGDFNQWQGKKFRQAVDPESKPLTFLATKNPIGTSEEGEYWYYSYYTTRAETSRVTENDENDEKSTSDDTNRVVTSELKVIYNGEWYGSADGSNLVVGDCLCLLVTVHSHPMATLELFTGADYDERLRILDLVRLTALPDDESMYADLHEMLDLSVMSMGCILEYDSSSTYDQMRDSLAGQAALGVYDEIWDKIIDDAADTENVLKRLEAEEIAKDYPKEGMADCVHEAVSKVVIEKKSKETSTSEREEERGVVGEKICFEESDKLNTSVIGIVNEDINKGFGDEVDDKGVSNLVHEKLCNDENSESDESKRGDNTVVPFIVGRVSDDAVPDPLPSNEKDMEFKEHISESATKRTREQFSNHVNEGVSVEVSMTIGEMISEGVNEAISEGISVCGDTCELFSLGGGEEMTQCTGSSVEGEKGEKPQKKEKVVADKTNVGSDCIDDVDDNSIIATPSVMTDSGVWVQGVMGAEMCEGVLESAESEKADSETNETYTSTYLHIPTNDTQDSDEIASLRPQQQLPSLPAVHETTQRSVEKYTHTGTDTNTPTTNGRSIITDSDIIAGKSSQSYQSTTLITQDTPILNECDVSLNENIRTNQLSLGVVDAQNTTRKSYKKRECETELMFGPMRQPTLPDRAGRGFKVFRKVTFAPTKLKSPTQLETQPDSDYSKFEHARRRHVHIPPSSPSSTSHIHPQPTQHAVKKKPQQNVNEDLISICLSRIDAETGEVLNTMATGLKSEGRTLVDIILRTVKAQLGEDIESVKIHDRAAMFYLPPGVQNSLCINGAASRLSQTRIFGNVILGGIDLEGSACGLSVSDFEKIFPSMC
eukprot:CFRG0198T1